MIDTQNQLIHIVGIINTEHGTGQFLYVTPVKNIVAQTTEGLVTASTSTDAELIVQAQDGTELAHMPVSLMRASDGDDSANAVIDQIIPIHEGMARLSLRYLGNEIAAYKAGKNVSPAATSAGISFGMPPPGSSNKREMSLDVNYAAEEGVTYTIQVRPEGENLWQTIAMGLPVPDTTLDRNQFPDAERAHIRIVRTNGFVEAIVAEESVQLNDQTN